MFIIVAAMGMHLLVLTLGWATGFSAYAFEKEGEYGYSDLPADISISTPTTPTVSPAPSPISQTPGSRVDQFERALNTLKIPLEPYPTELDSLSKTSTITLKDFEKVFKYIDGFGAVREYINIFPATKRNRPVIALYRDFYRPGISNKSYLDFATVLKTSGTSVDSTGLMARLDQISSQTRDTRNSPTARPLEGLKIAIDPGHMGGKEWDINTGKFVAPNGLENGPKVSEGDLNLFTSMLLAQKLEALGAEVRLTHSKQQPVSPYRYDNYNETPFLYSYIYSALDTWMSPFLGTSDSEYVGQMRKNLDELTTRRNYRQEQFFVRGEDLQARIDLINAFQPDLTLDFHYDASKTTELQSAVNEIKSYVPGGVMNATADLPLARESGSRKTRALILKHALEPHRWLESVKLAKGIVSAMSLSMKIPYRKETISNTKMVSPGVYARNLYMTLHSTQGLMVYLECLNYDHVSEFANLAKNDQKGSYQGQTFYYPTRLKSVVNGVLTGVLNYFEQRSPAIY